MAGEAEEVPNAANGSGAECADDDDRDGEVIDVSPTGCCLSSLACVPPAKSLHARELYMFDNVFTVLPSSMLRFRNLRVLKVFSNDARYFPRDLDDCFPTLQQLQVRASPLGLSSFLPLGKMAALQALELHQLPLRPSASFLPADIAQLQQLRRLSVCHFSIAYLPPEIGSLHKLQELDLSFNKLKLLPKEISGLVSLTKLRLASNKLVELPSVISKLPSIETIDVSYNRLISLLTVDLHAMTSLQELNAQYNRLQETGEIPKWLVCNFDGNEWLQSNSERKLVMQKDVQSSKYLRKCSKPADKVTDTRKIQIENSALPDEMVLLHDIDSDLKSSGESDLKQPENMKLLVKEKVTGDSASVHKRLGDCLGVGNPKPNKRPKSVENFSEVSYKYRKDSFCGFNDYLPDGFYDAGRDHPFLALDALENEECNFDRREVIIVDRTKDEELDAMASSAKQLPCFKTTFDHCRDDTYNVAMLALFVSDSFGGSDKTMTVKLTRRAALGSTSGLPFVCSCCSTVGGEAGVSLPSMRTLSEEAIRHSKLKRNSNVVPLGSLAYGVCRHRAILLKYLCDRSHPVIPCELIRGYLDYMPHAWNIVLVSRGGTNVRMLVDACRPLDIRLENDPEYFCRYIPMRRMYVQPRLVELGNDVFVPIFYEEIGVGASGAKVRKCVLEGHVAAAKIRQLDSSVLKEASDGGWLSELRMHCSIGEHPNVVSFYGHQLSFDSLAMPSTDKGLDAPQLIIFMEYIKGGSLDNVLNRFLKDGCLYAPPQLAMHIARSVVQGLAWLHSRGIIHRDIKSSNILLDLDSRLTPVVKICDFDSAVPVGSSTMHTCYLAHHGLPLSDVCVGTPRWIAPEVLGAIYTRQQYGLEADMWSFGCLISELLTLHVPYVGISDSEIHDHIKAGERPSLTWNLEELPLETEGDDKDLLEVLIRLYESCTEKNPSNRPTAQQALSSLQKMADKIF